MSDLVDRVEALEAFVRSFEQNVLARLDDAARGRQSAGSAQGGRSGEATEPSVPVFRTTVREFLADQCAMAGLPREFAWKMVWYPGQLVQWLEEHQVPSYGLGKDGTTAYGQEAVLRAYNTPNVGKGPHRYKVGPERLKAEVAAFKMAKGDNGVLRRPVQMPLMYKPRGGR